MEIRRLEIWGLGDLGIGSIIYGNLRVCTDFNRKTKIVNPKSSITNRYYVGYTQQGHKLNFSQRITRLLRFDK